MKIEELLENIVVAVQGQLPAVPPGLELKASFRRKRQLRATKKSAPVEKYFHPERGDEIVICFSKQAARRSQSITYVLDAPPDPSPIASPPASLSERLIFALHKLEADPRTNFVALKWFRDSVLPSEGFTPEQARRELNAAIEAGIVRVAKLANPKSPFPTSTLSLERGHDLVRATLQQPAPASRRGFSPVDLGLSVSDVILSERR